MSHDSHRLTNNLDEAASPRHHLKLHKENYNYGKTERVN